MIREQQHFFFLSYFPCVVPHFVQPFQRLALVFGEAATDRALHFAVYGDAVRQDKYPVQEATTLDVTFQGDAAQSFDLLDEKILYARLQRFAHCGVLC